VVLAHAPSRIDRFPLLAVRRERPLGVTTGILVRAVPLSQKDR
jgi:hypothetical protein